MLLRDILQAKGTRLINVPPGTSIHDAVTTMVENKIGAVLVVKDNNEPLGIFTERDNLRVTAAGIDATATPIDAYMTKDLVCGFPADSVEEASALMTERRVRHLPVVADGLLVGLVSIGDVVKANAEKISTEVHFLKEYIHNS